MIESRRTPSVAPPIAEISSSSGPRCWMLASIPRTTDDDLVPWSFDTTPAIPHTRYAASLLLNGCGRIGSFLRSALFYSRSRDRCIREVRVVASVAIGAGYKLAVVALRDTGVVLRVQRTDRVRWRRCRTADAAGHRRGDLRRGTGRVELGRPRVSDDGGGQPPVRASRGRIRTPFLSSSHEPERSDVLRRLRIHEARRRAGPRVARRDTGSGCPRTAPGQQHQQLL